MSVLVLSSIGKCHVEGRTSCIKVKTMKYPARFNKVACPNEVFHPDREARYRSLMVHRHPSMGRSIYESRRQGDPGGKLPSERGLQIRDGASGLSR